MEFKWESQTKLDSMKVMCNKDMIDRIMDAPAITTLVRGFMNTRTVEEISALGMKNEEFSEVEGSITKKNSSGISTRYKVLTERDSPGNRYEATISLGMSKKQRMVEVWEEQDICEVIIHGKRVASPVKTREFKGELTLSGLNGIAQQVVYKVRIEYYGTQECVNIRFVSPLSLNMCSQFMQLMARQLYLMFEATSEWDSVIMARQDKTVVVDEASKYTGFSGNVFMLQAMTTMACKEKDSEFVKTGRMVSDENMNAILSTTMEAWQMSAIKDMPRNSKIENLITLTLKNFECAIDCISHSTIWQVVSKFPKDELKRFCEEQGYKEGTTAPELKSIDKLRYMFETLRLQKIDLGDKPLIFSDLAKTLVSVRNGYVHNRSASYASSSLIQYDSAMLIALLRAMNVILFGYIWSLQGVVTFGSKILEQCK